MPRNLAGPTLCVINGNRVKTTLDEGSSKLVDEEEEEEEDVKRESADEGGSGVSGARDDEIAAAVLAGDGLGKQRTSDKISFL